MTASFVHAHPTLDQALHAPIQPCANSWVPQALDAGGDIYAAANLLDGEGELLLLSRGAANGAENTDSYVNLASQSYTEHILLGDATGDGHLYPGLPGKTSFPADWSPAKIMHAISDVATNPASTVVREGPKLLVSGTYDGVNITVVIGKNGDIRTGFPTNLPRNPKP